IGRDAVGTPTNLASRARRFAFAFLLPAEPFAEECPRTMDFVRFLELRHRWGAPLTVLTDRALHLGCIPESVYRKGWQRWTRAPRRVRPAYEPAYETPTLLSTGVNLLSLQWSTEKIAQALRMTPADVLDLVSPEPADAPKAARPH